MHAAEHPRFAAGDGRATAESREEAVRERRCSLVDRQVFGRRVPIAGTDSLTGARTRAAGLTDLERELDRCHRTGSGLVVVYVGVVGLKALNDAEGHDAGDQLLTRVVRIIKDHLRPYDLISRYGGDDFLCAMPDATLADARERFITIASLLADASAAGMISTGFAELAAGESAGELITRADDQRSTDR